MIHNYIRELGRTYTRARTLSETIARARVRDREMYSTIEGYRNESRQHKTKHEKSHRNDKADSIFKTY